MAHNTITLVPAGGLGNRMKAIAAGLALADSIGSQIRILWFQDWGLGCRFDQLFQLTPPFDCCLREASAIDKVLFDRPRRKNLYIPRLFERLLNDVCIEEEEATKKMDESYDFTSLCRNKRVWISSHVYFTGGEPPEGCFDLFHPVPKLKNEIVLRRQQLGTNAVGVHIRRTDNIRSVSDSPTELFVERMRQEPANTVFYLATDSEEEKRQLKQLFGQRLHCADRQAERGTLQGMEDALTEMYLLAGTSRILGSAASTYSMTAATIGHIPLEIITKCP